MPSRHRVLVIAEGGTLAHPTRCAGLAAMIARMGYEVIFATSREYLPVIDEIPGVRMIEISSPPTSVVLERLSAGKFFCTADELNAQFKENIRLLKEIQPGVVIGDLRLTLPPACRKLRIPCLTLVNHHWSPFVSSNYPVPDSAQTRKFGVRLSSLLSPLVTPFVLKAAMRPLNDFRRAEKLMPYRSLREAYCDGDYVMYVGLPWEARFGYPNNHRMIGPLLWSGGSRKLQKTNRSGTKHPTIFACLGCSGDQSLMPKVISALSSWKGTLILTHPDPKYVLKMRPKNTIVKPYIPIGDVLDSADLIIGNGGTATILAALASGIPYLALYTNLDQSLSVEHYRRTGAVFGDLALNVGTAKIRNLVDQALATSEMSTAAQRCKDEYHACGGDQWTVRQLGRVFSIIGITARKVQKGVAVPV